MQTSKRLICIILLIFPMLSMASNSIEHHFLVITDIHLDLQLKKPMDFIPSKQSSGRSGINDLDLPTFTALLATIKKNIKEGQLPTPRFILILGDVVGHRLLNSVETQGVVFDLLQKNFEGIPIFYTFGNNDSLSEGYGPFKAVKNTRLNSSYDIALQIGHWKDGFLSTGQHCDEKSIFPCIIEENSIHGYYSALLEPHLRMINLNSILFSPLRNLAQPEQATLQLKWFAKQLNEARALGESVLIATHISPAYNIYDHGLLWIPEYFNFFLQLIGQYQSNIIGILVAHTHQEELKMIKDKQGNNIVGMYFTAGLSTAYGNSPSIKSFSFKQLDQKWILTNYKTFRFSRLNEKITLSPLYNYHDYYCLNHEQSMLQCLHNVTTEKIKKYFTVGNNNFLGVINSPDDVIINVK